MIQQVSKCLLATAKQSAVAVPGAMQ